MAYQAILARPGVYRILIEQYPEGVYVDIFETATSQAPEQDHFQPDFLIALKQCERLYNVSAAGFSLVPDERRH